MMRVHRTIYFGLVLAVSSLLVGCGFFGGDAEPTPGPQVSLSYISFLSDAESNNVEPYLIEQFEAVHANITIDRRPYQQSARSYLNQTPPPDLLVAIADYDTFTAIDEGLALDISQIWREANLADVYPAGFRQFGEREGRQYFLPVASTWTAIYYNKPLFDQYNLVAPTTWDEFLNVAETLWQSGITPFALARNDDWSVSMWFDYLNIRLNGPHFHQDLLAGRIPFDDGRVQSALELWQTLIIKGYLGESQRSPGVMQSFHAVNSGEAAMVLSSPVLIQDLPLTWRDNLAFFSFPIIDPAQPVGEVAPSYGYLVPAATEHPAEVAQLLAYMSTAQVQTALVQQIGDNFGILPIHQGVDANDLPQVSQHGLTVLNKADVILRPFLFATPEAMASRAERAFQTLLRDPEAIADVIEQLEQARQQSYPSQ